MGELTLKLTLSERGRLKEDWGGWGNRRGEEKCRMKKNNFKIVKRKNAKATLREEHMMGSRRVLGLNSLNMTSSC